MKHLERIREKRKSLILSDLAKIALLSISAVIGFHTIDYTYNAINNSSVPSKINLPQSQEDLPKYPSQEKHNNYQSQEPISINPPHYLL